MITVIPFAVASPNLSVNPAISRALADEFPLKLDNFRIKLL